MADFDLAIIGGGVNGAGIARDAAGRGLRVLLVEQNDLASGTSSASSKLVHGGLRYLEQGAFRLVREALNEREVLMRIAPQLVRPMRFVLPVSHDGRAPWLLRLGLFLYDWLGARKTLPAAQSIDLTHHPFGIPLKRPFGRAFAYSDCWVDDARLVILNARDAVERRADIRPRTKCVRAERGKEWRLSLLSRGVRTSVTARALVDATGPWHNIVAETILHVPRPKARLVKGSHLIVPRLYDHDSAYIFQNPDGRVVFAIPFARDFTMIGTTDAVVDGDLSALSPSAAEITYLCNAVNAYFRQPVSPSDVVRTMAGVRSLVDDGTTEAQNATRDYVLRLDTNKNEAPLLTIYGGKITTYRKLAEHALGKMSKIFGRSRPWTADVPLPGSDFSNGELDDVIDAYQRRWTFLGKAHVARLIHLYGTRAERIVGKARTADDLGQNFGGDLTAAEVDFLMREEWATTADDVVWRRTKLAMVLTREQIDELDRYMRVRGGFGTPQ